jgi:hypothetical protein
MARSTDSLSNFMTERNSKGVTMSNLRRLCCLLLVLLAAIAASSAAVAQASGGTITREDVTGDLIVCDGNVLTVTAGTFQVVTHETLTPSGAYHLIVEGNAQGVKAVASNGATYQAPGGFWIEVNVTPGATVQTQTGVLNVIGQGSAPDFTARGVVHTTVDANGNVTAFVDHFTATGSCIVPPMG